MSLSPRLLQLVENEITGINVTNKYGRNLNITADTVSQIIWSGGNTYPFPTSAQTLEIVSNSANDTLAGTGAQKVIVEGLDANWIKQEIEVELNGITPAAISGTWIRVYRAYVNQVGSAYPNNVNVGTINIQVSGGGDILAIIEPGIGQTLMCIFTTGVNETGFIKKFDTHILRTTSVVRGEGELVFSNGSTGLKVKRTFAFTDTSPYDESVFGAIKIPPQTDVFIRKIDVSLAARISSSMDIYVERTY